MQDTNSQFHSLTYENLSLSFGKNGVFLITILLHCKCNFCVVHLVAERGNSNCVKRYAKISFDLFLIAQRQSVRVPTTPGIPSKLLEFKKKNLINVQQLVNEEGVGV